MFSFAFDFNMHEDYERLFLSGCSRRCYVNKTNSGASKGFFSSASGLAFTFTQTRKPQALLLLLLLASLKTHYY